MTPPRSPRLLRSALRSTLLAAAVASPLPLAAQTAAAPAPSVVTCATEAEWNAPQRPFRLYGNTWWVGTRCLGALLVTSDSGHVLVDAGLPTSAAPIRASIEALGFRLADVKLIVNSHAHFDHAGGIAELQRASGAAVAAHPFSARELDAGENVPGDPQYGLPSKFPAVRGARLLRDREVVRVGPLALTAHFTGGHTPGGTTWAWRSCEGDRCLDLVYADSQTPISADGFLYTRSTDYPDAVADFGRGHARLEEIACDVLVTPHPGASRMWERVEGAGRPGAPALVDPEGCRRYAASARQALARRVATEQRR